MLERELWFFIFPYRGCSGIRSRNLKYQSHSRCMSTNSPTIKIPRLISDISENIIWYPPPHTLFGKSRGPNWQISIFNIPILIFWESIFCKFYYGSERCWVMVILILWWHHQNFNEKSFIQRTLILTFYVLQNCINKDSIVINDFVLLPFDEDWTEKSPTYGAI